MTAEQHIDIVDDLIWEVFARKWGTVVADYRYATLLAGSPIPMPDGFPCGSIDSLSLDKKIYGNPRLKECNSIKPSELREARIKKAQYLAKKTRDLFSRDRRLLLSFSERILSDAAREGRIIACGIQMEISGIYPMGELLYSSSVLDIFNYRNNRHFDLEQYSETAFVLTPICPICRDRFDVMRIDELLEFVPKATVYFLAPKDMADEWLAHLLGNRPEASPVMEIVENDEGVMIKMSGQTRKIRLRFLRGAVYVDEKSSSIYMNDSVDFSKILPVHTGIDSSFDEEDGVDISPEYCVKVMNCSRLSFPDRHIAVNVSCDSPEDLSEHVKILKCHNKVFIDGEMECVDDAEESAAVRKAESNSYQSDCFIIHANTRSIIFEYGGRRRSFDARACFSLVPSKYERFAEDTAINMQIRKVEWKRFPHGGMMNAVALPIDGNGRLIADPEYYQYYTKASEGIKNKGKEYGRKVCSVLVASDSTFLKPDYDKVIKAVQSISNRFSFLDEHSLGYWLRHTDIKPKEVLDSKKAKDSLERILNELRSIENLEKKQLDYINQAMDLIKGKSGKSTPAYYGMLLYHLEKTAAQMPPEPDGKKYLSSERDKLQTLVSTDLQRYTYRRHNLIQIYLLTALESEYMDDAVSKAKFDEQIREKMLNMDTQGISHF